MILKHLRRAGAASLRALLQYHDDAVYHRAQNYLAKQAYNEIVRQDPGRRLTESTRKQILDYACSALGSKVYAPWLETYTAYRGSFHEGWLPDNYVGHVLVKRGTPHFLSLGRKTIAARFFQTDLFPDLAYSINGFLYDRAFRPVAAADVPKVVFAEHETAFLKVEDSSHGRDVFRLERNGFDIGSVMRLGNFVIQSPVEQHPFFLPFSPGGAATLRLTTVKPKGRPAELRAAYLRGGRASDSYVRSDRQVRVPIELSSGTLHAEGANADWTRTDRHPDTGAVFAGATIPAFSRAAEACLALHDSVPHLIYIGWDACVTPEGEVRLFEVNTRHPAITFTEAASGPIFLGLGLENLHRTGIVA
jgi:hypothetical protein